MSIKDWGINSNWTLFLDRDGVINERIIGGYVTCEKEFVFKKGVKHAIVGLTEEFKHILVVTNQQGIGKGIMTKRNLQSIHDYMCEEIMKVGGKIDKCYFAPNIKGESPDFRKPGVAMAELAKGDFPELNYSKCVMIGDTDTDVLFGKNLGMKTVRVLTEEPIAVPADLNVIGLDDFLKKLKNED